MRIEGTIIGGKQLGRTIGFPTANLQPTDTEALWPDRGVYTAWIEIEGMGVYRSMLNVGSHPTAPDGPPTIEAFILDFSEDIYGRKAVIEPLLFLRPETKFESLDALKAQLDFDHKRTRVYFEKMNT